MGEAQGIASAKALGQGGYLGKVQRRAQRPMWMEQSQQPAEHKISQRLQAMGRSGQPKGAVRTVTF